MYTDHVLSLHTSEKEDLLALWNGEYPVQLAYTALNQLEVFLDSLEDPYHLMLRDPEKQIKGWAFSFDRDNERWFAILIDHSIHGKGFGRSLMNQLKAHDTVLNGWVIDHDRDIKANGNPYLSPLGFYKKCGFTILSDQRLELDLLSAVKIRWTLG